MAAILGWWRYNIAEDTATEFSDRALLSAALAISRDIIISEGDAILPSTNQLIEDAAGGKVFYHATGPGGYYVTGYAYPPVNDQILKAATNTPQFYEAQYRGDSVRVLRMTERVTIDSITGSSTISVWQRVEERESITRKLAIQSAMIMSALLLSLALVVWLAVHWGLRPLTDLEEAIAIRSANDLSTIKRQVPKETQGIVNTINRLFQQVENSIIAHQGFISDASHQLRNRAAAVQSMAEAIHHVDDSNDRNKRVGELIDAARENTRVTDQLLSLDRLQQEPDPSRYLKFDLNQLTSNVCTKMAANFLSRGIAFEYHGHSCALEVEADKRFVNEAIINLIDNACRHGGEQLQLVRVTCTQNDTRAEVIVYDDGKPLQPEDSAKAFGRFSQVEPSAGSGLGLAITASVAERHNGTLDIRRVTQGAELVFSLPLFDRD